MDRYVERLFVGCNWDLQCGFCRNNRLKEMVDRVEQLHLSETYDG